MYIPPRQPCAPCSTHSTAKSVSEKKKRSERQKQTCVHFMIEKTGDGGTCAIKNIRICGIRRRATYAGRLYGIPVVVG